MVHCSLTRSDWYSLFLANRKWEKKVSTAFWHGKGLLVSTALTGRERVCTVTTGKGYGCCDMVLLLDIQHLPVICNVRLAGDRNWRGCRFGCRRCGWRCGWSWYPRDAC